MCIQLDECDPAQGLNTFDISQVYVDFSKGKLGQDFDLVLRLDLEAQDIDLLLGDALGAPEELATET